MRQEELYYNIESRVPTLEVLNQLEGRAGKRVLVEELGKFFYWNKANNVWTREDTVGDYKNYTCQLFQNGTSDAYDNVLGTHSLSGNITWERLTFGLYRGTLVGAFPALRTQLFYTSIIAPTLLSSSPPGNTIYRIVTVQRIDDDTIFVRQVENSTLNPIDGLYGLDLEIRVYPTNSLND